MYSKKNYGLSDDLISAAKSIASTGSVPLTKVEAEIAERAGTTPKTPKEKSLAKLAEPKDKITHKDVMVGRGVAKEQAEVFSQEELAAIARAAEQLQLDK